MSHGDKNCIQENMGMFQSTPLREERQSSYNSWIIWHFFGIFCELSIFLHLIQLTGTMRFYLSWHSNTLTAVWPPEEFTRTLGSQTTIKLSKDLPAQCVSGRTVTRRKSDAARRTGGWDRFQCTYRHLLPNPDKRDKRVNEVIFCQKNAENNF